MFKIIQISDIQCNLSIFSRHLTNVYDYPSNFILADIGRKPSNSDDSLFWQILLLILLCVAFCNLSPRVSALQGFRSFAVCLFPSSFFFWIPSQSPLQCWLFSYSSGTYVRTAEQLHHVTALSSCFAPRGSHQQHRQYSQIELSHFFNQDLKYFELIVAYVFLNVIGFDHLNDLDLLDPFKVLSSSQHNFNSLQ